MELHPVQQLTGCEEETVLVVPQDFDCIPFLIAEDKNRRPLERVQFELYADNCGKPRDMLPEVPWQYTMNFPSKTGDGYVIF